MGCDLLALNLVREWEFLSPPPVETLPSQLTIGLMDNMPNPSKLLKRRTSLVVADMPLSPGLRDEIRKASEKQTPAHGSHPPPTTFQEPDASSLLDSFGF